MTSLKLEHICKFTTSGGGSEVTSCRCWFARCASAGKCEQPLSALFLEGETGWGAHPRSLDPVGCSHLPAVWLASLSLSICICKVKKSGLQQKWWEGLLWALGLFKIQGLRHPGMTVPGCGVPPHTEAAVVTWSLLSLPGVQRELVPFLWSGFPWLPASS